MKAARRLISGEGELENGWNRLFGSNNGLPSVFGRGVDSNLPGLRNSGGSFLTVCPCGPNEEAILFSTTLRAGRIAICSLPLTLAPFLVDIVLCPNASREARNLLCEAPLGCLSAWRHLWQVYEEDEGRILYYLSFAAQLILQLSK
jgi:hypothetical protein